jgi:hypothetical protein
MKRSRLLLASAAISFLSLCLYAQDGHNAAAPPPPGLHTIACAKRPVPQFEDITAKAGITFKHFSDPNKRYIPESMGGGVILIDYDRDGWPDIYFTNAPSIAMQIAGKHVEGALYHRCHGEGRPHARVLRHGRRHRRYQQQRLARPVPHLPRRQHSLP